MPFLLPRPNLAPHLHLLRATWPPLSSLSSQATRAPFHSARSLRSPTFNFDPSTKRLRPFPPIFSSIPNLASIIGEKLTLPSPRTSEELFDVVDALDQEIKAHLRLPKRIFRSSAHHGIASMVLEACEKLANNRQELSMGIASRTIVGAKGIGKTTMLHTLTEMIPLIHPKIISVFATFDNLSPKSEFIRSGFSEVLREKLAIHGVHPTGPPNATPIDRILWGLDKEDRYLFLIVDELDQVYKHDPDKYNVCEELLTDLGRMASQDGGRVITIACGSSASLPELITATTRGVDLDEFQLLKKVRHNLNSSKFRSHRIFTEPPTNLESAASLIRQNLSNVNTKQKLRAIVFFTGLNARNIERYLNSSVEFKDELAHLSSRGGKTLQDPLRKDFWTKVTESLLAKNKELLEDLFEDGRLSMDRVQNVPWEDRLRPLSYAEVKQIARDIGVVDDSKGKPGALTILHHFVDRSWFCCQGMNASEPEWVYPMSLYSLAERHSYHHYRSTYEDVLTFASRMVRSLKGSAPTLVNLFGPITNMF